MSASTDLGTGTAGGAPGSTGTPEAAALAIVPGRARSIRLPRSPKIIIGMVMLGFFLIPGSLAPRPPAVRVELIAENPEEPRLEVGTGFECATRLPRLGQRLLREIVRDLDIVRQRAGKCAQKWDQLAQIRLELVVGIRLGSRFIAGI